MRPVNRHFRSVPVCGPARSRSRGVGLVELLIALAICASLLTAVAVALDASLKSYRINQEQSALTQRVRLGLHRILTEVRKTDAHAPATSSLLDNFAAGQIVTDSGISMFDEHGEEVTYAFNAAAQRIEVTRDGATRTLVNGVTQFTVTLEPMRSSTSIRTGGPYDLLNRATILMTVRTVAETAQNSETTGQQTVTISSSVMPRRNVW
jgi:Tfp pilus assembly protein PilW